MATDSKQIKRNIEDLPINEGAWIARVFDKKEVQAKFKAIIESRMTHCFTKLLQNLSSAQVTDFGRQIVIFKGGHFSMPVYEALEEALGQDMEQWSALVWQQILRQMFEDNNRDFLLHQIATEGCLCGVKFL